jgi:hypothetical protein
VILVEFDGRVLRKNFFNIFDSLPKKKDTQRTESRHPSRGYFVQSPLLRGISTFTKFIHTLFSTLLRGEKQEMNF